MHYFKFNIKDYASKTGHLDPLEDIAYRRMIDLLYLTEKALPNDVDRIAKLIRMRSHSDCIEDLLSEFFTLENDGWHCKRVDIELFAFKEKSEKAANSAKARWEKSKAKQQDNSSSEGYANASGSQSEGNANKEPSTINHQPITNNQLKENEEFQDGLSKDDFMFSEWFFERVKTINSNQKKPNFKNWANDVRLIRERDKKTHNEMATLMQWANSDDFWQSNILSPKKLREHWDKLTIQMNRKPKSNQPTYMSNATQQTVNNLMNVEFK